MQRGKVPTGQREKLPDPEKDSFRLLWLTRRGNRSKGKQQGGRWKQEVPAKTAATMMDETKVKKSQDTDEKQMPMN